MATTQDVFQSVHGADAGWPFNKMVAAIQAAGQDVQPYQARDEGAAQALRTWCPGGHADHRKDTRELLVIELANGRVKLSCLSGKACDTRNAVEHYGLTQDDLQRSPTGELLELPHRYKLPPPSAPVAVAREFLQARYAGDPPTFCRWRSTFYTWEGSAWVERDDDAVRADLYHWLSKGYYLEEDRKTHELVEVSWAPNKSRVANVFEALAAGAHLPQDVEDRSWISYEDERFASDTRAYAGLHVSSGLNGHGGTGRHASRVIVPLSTSLLCLPDRTYLPVTSAFFTLSSIPVTRAMEKNACLPVPQWLAFLASLWPNDPDAVRLLQEWMGYVVSGDTRYQKMLLLVGPPRAGKGIIGNVLTALCGMRNVASPTMAGLVENFGLEPLIGKTLAVVSDARFSGREPSIVVERLLTISGEGDLTVPRKFKSAWNGRLRTRFMFLTNELPRLGDASGALAGRFMPLEMRHSWLGREDLDLQANLMDELPGILLWALDGFDRLQQQRRFTLPESSRDATITLLEITSPILAFVRERCLVGPQYEIAVDKSFEVWQTWCQANGREHTGDKSRFGRDLRAAIPGLETGQRGTGKDKLRVFRGFRLRTDDDQDPEPPAQPPAPTTSQEPEVARAVPDESPEPPTVEPGDQAFRVDPVLIREVHELEAALPEILASPVVGLDVETTGLNPFRDRIRLVQLGVGLDRAFVVDMNRLPFKLLQPVLDQIQRIVIHNAKFELRFLLRSGLVLPQDIGHRLADTFLYSRLLTAGDRSLHNGLEDAAQRYLKLTLDKAQQKSDWSGELTEDQLRYAAADAAILPQLRQVLVGELGEARLAKVARLENRCLPAVAWLEDRGIYFDLSRHGALLEKAQTDLERAEVALERAAGKTINWASWQQLLVVLQEQGIEVESTSEPVLNGVDHPFARLVTTYRHAKKLVGMFGPEFVKHVEDATGRIHAEFRQIGADSGRMSCHKPNLQQVPRAADYRGCFRAPEGRVLVKADYSQIELRIAAEISGDRRMLEAYATGEDLHTLTASQVMGRSEVSKADRQAAKAVNFGLIYGMGAGRLRAYARDTYQVELSEEQAQAYRTRFFETYPGLKRWHQSQREGMIATRTLAGRRRLKIDRFTEKLNSPVQGTGADGLKLGLARLYERRDQLGTAFPVHVVHDEIVLEASEQEADQVAAHLREAMVDGMGELLSRVPVDVEIAVAKSWGGGN